MSRIETEYRSIKEKVGILKEPLDRPSVAFRLGGIQEQLEIKTYFQIRPQAGMERSMTKSAHGGE